ncbi:MAG: hypothetical protein EXX96DRAFT_585094 [Benjaminiella poitrasii]|nr:MAG: hypothetical protein EXX96DRAFT_585094 [Benjaminiella poitrasii]
MVNRLYPTPFLNLIKLIFIFYLIMLVIITIKINVYKNEVGCYYILCQDSILNMPFVLVLSWNQKNIKI